MIYRREVEKYIEKNHPGLRVAYHANNKSRWIYDTYDEYHNDIQHKDLKWNHRQIFPEEIVIDLDDDKLEINTINVDKICDNLQKLKISYNCYYTGGKGYHLHSLFEGLENVKEPKLLKEKLVEYMIGEDKSIKYDKQLLGNHLVRFEGGKYEKNYKGNVKEPYKPFTKITLNKIPTIVWKEYQKTVLRFALGRLRQGRRIRSIGETPECMKFILSPEFKEYKDGGKRALFVVASFYHHLPYEQLYNLLEQFNHYNLKIPVNKMTLISTIKGVKNHKGRRVGCNFRHELLNSIGARKVVEKCVGVTNKLGDKIE